jgi:amidohydrolase
MSGIDEILAGYENLRPGQEDFYRDLHQHPELSHQEHQTARRVAGRLRGDGFTVHEGIGGTGVAGVLANGSGPTVLLRCELDALRETTGAPFASTVTVKGAQGQEVSVDHACGHDMHMACMTTMATLMAARRDQWNGTLITLFQPAEETGEGAQEMVDDGLFTRIPVPDVALAQHLLPGIAGTVATCPGPFMSAADSIRITVYGRGGHGSMPQHAVLELNMRSYSAVTRQRMLDAIGRIVRAECQASGSPKDPEFETIFTFPVTDNDPAATGRVAKAPH